MENTLKKIILLITLLSLSLFAEAKNSYMTQAILDSNMAIVDIRTPPEWKETGLLKGAIPIMFFNQKGNPQINNFLKELTQKVDVKKQFAIICHTGSRTSVVAPWLAKNFNYDVINIQGGMDYATKGLKMKTYPYKK